MKAKRLEEKRDKLGYTFEDYIAMQERVEKEIRAEDLRDGWDISKEQTDLINAPENVLHGVAVLCFYEANKYRLSCMAWSYMRHHQHLYTVIEADDLLQQLYCDLLCGALKLPHDTGKISSAIYKSFTYAAVGGMEGIA